MRLTWEPAGGPTMPTQHYSTHSRHTAASEERHGTDDTRHTRQDRRHTAHAPRHTPHETHAPRHTPHATHAPRHTPHATHATRHTRHTPRLTFETHTLLDVLRAAAPGRRPFRALLALGRVPASPREARGTKHGPQTQYSAPTRGTPTRNTKHDFQRRLKRSTTRHREAVVGTRSQAQTCGNHISRGPPVVVVRPLLALVALFKAGLRSPASAAERRRQHGIRPPQDTGKRHPNPTKPNETRSESGCMLCGVGTRKAGRAWLSCQSSLLLR